MSDVPPTEDGEGLEVRVAARRESALEKLKKQLAEREAPVPQLEGYSLAKARKILRLVGLEESRLRVKYVESEAERGEVVTQRPRPGQKVDLDDEDQKIELRVADASIVRYLPSIYNRSDLTGRNFVRDMLWIFQHEFNATDEKLEGLERFFDPLECPREFLDYIASWVALTLEDDWPEVKKRNLIKKAVELYHLRGTPRGLRVFLRIFTGVDPKIHENVWPFDGVTVGISSEVGVDTVLMHHVDRSHAFVVEIPLPIADVDAQTILKIHRIIEREKPAHTDYYVIFAAPEEKEDETGFTVGVSSTIGVDTWVGGAEAEAYFPMEDEGGMETEGEES
ncbi:MAG TPA: phage tail protein [Planctomycetota bacterium]|nr:phage tail protein [Planctomycetota bacterium]